MFDNLTIRSKNSFADLGSLSESLIFYQKTNLILDPVTLEQALRTCGYENLVELIESEHLSIKYCRDALGGGNYRDNIYMISAFTSEKQRKFKTIRESVQKVYGKGVRSKKMFNRLNELIDEHKYDTEFTDLLKKELEDNDNLISAITIVSKGKFNSSNIEIESNQIKPGFYQIESNVDKKIINDAIFFTCTGSGDIYDAQLYNSTLSSLSNSSNYTEDKIIRLLRKRVADLNEIKIFHEKILPNFLDVKNTIDSGVKDFDELMKVWRVAEKFKSWLADEEVTEELLIAYNQKISEKSWLQHAGVRKVRWILFVGLGKLLGDEIGGTLGSAANLGIDYFDDFILQKLLNQWKPNLFVQGEYKDFLKHRME